MTRPTHAGVARNLVLVTLIVAVPILGGAVSGILLDRMLGATPLFMFVGVGGGNVVAALGVWLLARRISREGGRAAGGE